MYGLTIDRGLFMGLSLGNLDYLNNGMYLQHNGRCPVGVDGGAVWGKAFFVIPLSCNCTNLRRGVLVMRIRYRFGGIKFIALAPFSVLKPPQGMK